MRNLSDLTNEQLQHWRDQLEVEMRRGNRSPRVEPTSPSEIERELDECCEV